jgi:hypothetical protein
MNTAHTPAIEQANALAYVLGNFVPREQGKALLEICRTKEGREEMAEPLTRLVATIAAMPKTYQQENLGEEAVIHLHYFTGGCDWWITERDIDDDGEGQVQAFGYADLGDPQNSELGYISIKELCAERTMNVDLYWAPITLRELKAKRERRAA